MLMPNPDSPGNIRKNKRISHSCLNPIKDLLTMLPITLCTQAHKTVLLCLDGLKIPDLRFLKLS